MKNVITIILVVLQAVTYAHSGGHSYSDVWIINDKPLEAEFLKYEDEKVFLLNQEHELLSFTMKELSPKDQRLIAERYEGIKLMNDAQEPSYRFLFDLLFGLGILLAVLSLFLFLKKEDNTHLSYGALGVLIVTISACSKDDSVSPTISTTGNDVSFMQSIFEQFSGVTTSSDDSYFYVSSQGIPNHNMMTGITNWQQQVPIDHDYSGSNSWAIPIEPVLSESPLSTETNLLKGAIAIAVNGIPIFNPLNNRGEDAHAIGELDQWGGHCGKADDYHYHIPPTHLQSIVGEDNPIAYAVDGFPIYGETTEELDEFLGRQQPDGSFGYHTISEYPYFIPKMRGVVTLDPNTSAPENQVIPQATTQGVRPSLAPLAGAVITDFQASGTNSYVLTYTLNNESYQIKYYWDDNDLYTYTFIHPNGSFTTETYQR